VSSFRSGDLAPARPFRTSLAGHGFSVKPPRVAVAAERPGGGATVPFIARRRKCVSGLGPQSARSIVEHPNTRGPFRSCTSVIADLILMPPGT